MILTWEYPPRMIGEISNYTRNLSEELVKRHLEVTVVTSHDGPTGKEISKQGVEVWRMANPVEPNANIITWALNITPEFQRALADIYYLGARRVAIVDAQEWQCVVAAVALKKAFGLPFVYTVHSLEDHRSMDATSPLSICIKGLEWLGGFESAAVIARSARVLNDLEGIHKIPRDKIRLVTFGGPSWADETLKVYKEVARRSITVGTRGA